MNEPLDMAMLLDREAIRDCIQRCVLGNDRRDARLWKGAYWPDAHEDHAPLFTGNAHAFVDAMIDLLNTTMDSTWHQFGDPIIRIEGQSARALCYGQAYVRMKENGSTPAFVLQTGLRYLDRFEKRAGEWRILYRETVTDWIAQRPVGEPVVDMGTPPGMQRADDPAVGLFPEGLSGLVTEAIAAS